MDLVVEELSLIVAFVDEFEDSLASFGAVSVLTLVHLTVKPLLDTIAVLLVVFPFSYVFCPIFVSVGSLATGFIICPFTLVDITISMV